ncbi:hypothetical protein ACWZHB_01085 [Nocardia sp. FBN12]|uniref:hypothetical protein n=1 Tax=Nocardia sp. FBN12 TaxID=3419766 RepID=UPI003D059CC4
MVLGLLTAFGSVVAIGVLIVCLTPSDYGDLEPKIVTRRRHQPFYYYELLDLLDHTAPEEPMTLERAHRESQLHAMCPPWLCPRKNAAIELLESKNRRSLRRRSIL